MDRKAIIAIVLCAAFLLAYRPLLKLAGFDRYLEPARPTPAAVDTSGRSSRAPGTGASNRTLPPIGTPPVTGGSQPASIGESRAESPTSIEQTYFIETPLYRATFSDHGARLISTEIKRYASAHGVSSVQGKSIHVPRGSEVPPGDRVVLAGGPLMALDLGSGASTQSLANLSYAVAESLDAAGNKRALVFTAHDTSGLAVRQTWRVRPDSYALDLEVEIRGVPPSWRIADYTITTHSWPTGTERDTVADARALRASSLVGTNLRREHFGALVKGEKRFEGSVVWSAVQSRYFIGAIAADPSAARAVVVAAQRRGPGDGARTPSESDVISSTLVMGLPGATTPAHRFVVYAGPSEYASLIAAGHQLQRAVDMGWQWVLPVSHTLLLILNWLYGLLRNYGLAILAIATLVRLLLHPLNMMSMKSMRSMQKLQPELERIREKYKSDPTAMNTAVMGLYKENKVNPAGGCLPMLLQMPLFIALYQVLFNAIELRQAPFVAWINDLSAPDQILMVAGFPLRLLPVLMLGSGFLAQLVTPTDPRQKPTMYMMNLVMLVFFYNLPSGLVLYWTIMNVLTALQQWMVLRQDTVSEVVVPASVVPPRRARDRKAARS